MIASTIPPPLRFTASPESGHLPTSYIFVSYPAGVAWFLTSGAQGSFFKRAKSILQGENPPSTPLHSEGTTPKASSAEMEAFFIAGSQDQFTSPKTLMSWLKTNAGLSPPTSQNAGPASWAVTRPDGAIHVDVLEGVDHFWLDREQKLLDALKNWWNDSHPV